MLLTLQPLDDEAVRALVRRAVIDPRGPRWRGHARRGRPRTIVVRLAGGDVRKALTALEAAAAGAGASGVGEVDLATAEAALDKAALRYDRDGDAHYDVVSAFIKSMRGSDVDAALHYLARMIVAGEDARFVARRMVIFASEDIGMADPTALLAATAAAHAVEYVGPARGPAEPGPGRDPPGYGAEVECGDPGHRRGDRGRPGGPRRCACRAICATRTTPGRVGSGTAPGTPTRTTIRAVSCRSGMPLTTCWIASTTVHRGHGAERALAERVAKLRTVVRSPETSANSERQTAPQSRSDETVGGSPHPARAGEASSGEER